jgi:hypothetical protein
MNLLPLRFNAYSLETYQRRNKQPFTKELVGHIVTDVFHRMKRNLPTHNPQWGNFIPDDHFLTLLEEGILKAGQSDLLQLDKDFEAFDNIVPEHFAKAIELRMMQIIKDTMDRKLQHENTYRYEIPGIKADLPKITAEMEALGFQRQYTKGDDQ